MSTFDGNTYFSDMQREVAQQLNSIISSENSAILIGEEGVGKTTIARLVAEHFRSPSAVYFAYARDVDMTYLTEAVKSFPSSQHILVISDIDEADASSHDTILTAVRKGIENGHTFILTARTMPRELEDTVNLKVITVPNLSALTVNVEFVSEPLEIFIDPGNASVETLQEVFDALSELNVACGGLGLTFKTDGKSVFAVSEVEQ